MFGLADPIDGSHLPQPGHFCNLDTGTCSTGARTATPHASESVEVNAGRFPFFVETSQVHSRAQRCLHHPSAGTKYDSCTRGFAKGVVEVMLPINWVIGKRSKRDVASLDHACKLAGGDDFIHVTAHSWTPGFVLLGRAWHDRHDERSVVTAAVRSFLWRVC